MNTHADKIKENKSQAVANSLPVQQISGKSAVQFVTGRPEAVAQKELQDAINNSPRVRQLKAYQEMANNSSQVKHLRAYQSMADNYASLARDKDAWTGTTDLESKQTKISPNACDNNQGIVQAKAGNDVTTSRGSDNDHLAAKKKGNSVASSANPPVQRQAWLFEKADETGEYPVLLTHDGAYSILTEYGYRLDGPARLAAFQRIVSDPMPRYYAENKLGAKELYEDILALAQPIATLSFNYRYHDNRGRGALKYDPVGVSTSRPMNLEAINHLRNARVGNEEPKFNFQNALRPGCTNVSHKIMVVPSVGCPEFLKNERAVMHLQWAAYARERPTVLFVPQSELEIYQAQLGEMLARIGVGLVAWSSPDGLLGFGASRLAAQQYALSIDESRREVVLCDVNAVVSEDVAEGYDTGDESDGVDRSIKAVKGPGKYSAAGFGTGIPLRDYDAEDDDLTRTTASRGGGTRPIEQVVIVNDIMLYDPSFITSSEDADLTNALLAQEEPLHEPPLTSEKFKHDAAIEKVGMTSKSLSDHAYMHQRAQLLERLSYEDHILIKYRKGQGKGKRKRMVERIISIGELAKEIAVQHGLDQREIRSLIVEKIILEAKRRQRTPQSRVPDSGTDSSDDEKPGSASAEPGFASRHSDAGTIPSLKDVLHRSVMSEAKRFEADRFYDIGFADGTDHNCSIISIFKAAGIDISREQAQNYRSTLGVDLSGGINLTADIAREILNLVSEETHERYTLHVVHEDVPDERTNPQHGTSKLTDNGGDTHLFLFFAGTHFSPAWHK